jgi:hypothetical protein
VCWTLAPKRTQATPNREVLVYRVYYIMDTVEHYEGFYETQEEAEEVAQCVSDDYDAERVEVRDRYDNILFVIGDETLVSG